MNKALLAGALIAATLVPAAAQAQDRDHDRREWRDDQRHYDRRDDRRDDHREHRAYRGHGDWHAPFAYRSFTVGVIAPRTYWHPSYYVNDWGRYRLPRPARGYYRYVRHYGDLLLINTRNGRVIRVYRSYYR